MMASAREIIQVFGRPIATCRVEGSSLWGSSRTVSAKEGAVPGTAGRMEGKMEDTTTNWTDSVFNKVVAQEYVKLCYARWSIMHPTNDP